MEYSGQSTRQGYVEGTEDIISWVCSRDGHQVLCVCEHDGSELFQQSRSAAKSCLRFERRLEDYFCELGDEAEEWPQELVDKIRKNHASLCRLTDGDFPDLSAIGFGSTKEKRARSVAVALLITACMTDEHLAGIPEGGSLDDLATGLESVCAKARAIFPADGERCGAPQLHPQEPPPQSRRERRREHEDIAQPAPSNDFQSGRCAYSPKVDDEVLAADQMDPQMLLRENQRLQGRVAEERRLRHRLEEKVRNLSQELAASDRAAAKLEREVARKDGEVARKDRELAQTERRLSHIEDDNRRLRQDLDNSQRERFEDRHCSASAMPQSDEDLRGARPWKSRLSRCKQDLGGDEAEADADGAREEQEELDEGASRRSRSPFEEPSESSRRGAHPSPRRRGHQVQWHPRLRTPRNSEHTSGLNGDWERRR